MKACPKCRGERGYAETCVIKGIDEFLTMIKPLVQISEEGPSSVEEEN